MCIRDSGITAGIGLFIALVGLKGAGVVVGSDSTLVDLGKFSSPEVVLAMVGLIIIAALHHRNVKGSVLIGSLVTWVLGMGAQAIGWYQGNSLLPDFSNWTLFPVVHESTILQFDFAWVGQNLLSFAVIVFSFLFVDIFDTVGTLIGVAQKGNLLDKDGKLPKVGGALMADAGGTVVGSCLGLSLIHISSMAHGTKMT